MLGIADEIATGHLRLVKIKEDFIAAACPFHKGGEERKPSFWINRHTGKWGCFSCSAGNSDLKYLLKELGISSRKVEAQLDEAAREAENTAELEAAKRKKRARASFQGEYTLPESLLGVYDWLPEVALEWGFNEKVLAKHKVGYDQQRDRITFPIWDVKGNLIGISGRTTVGDEPKYLVYTGRRIIDGREVLGELGEWYPNYSSEGIRDHLWREQFVYPRLFRYEGQLIIVEGYKAAMWLHQMGWKNVVALMGSRMSKGQERRIRRMGAETFVLLDNNEPGQEGAEWICQRLGVSTFPVYRCDYPDYCDEHAQPDDLNETELEDVLSTGQRIGGKPYVRKFRTSQSSSKEKRGRGRRW